jgi:malate synthase
MGVATKGARLTEDDPGTGVKAGDVFSTALFNRLLEEEYDKLQKATNRDVYDASKNTTLPISKEIAEVYVLSDFKAPWFVDLLNINLNNIDLQTAKERIALYMKTFKEEGTRITANPDFVLEMV